MAPKVAGSSPVGHPTRFRRGKLNRRNRDVPHSFAGVGWEQEDNITPTTLYRSTG